MSNFDALHEQVPFLLLEDEELHSTVINLADDVRIKTPGKYAEITDGGDFVVETLVGDKWKAFRHADFFFMVSDMVEQDPTFMRNKFAPAMVMLSKGVIGMDDIDSITGGPYSDTVSPRALLRTLLAIMVAEHRRAAFAEPVGGRNLVVRFLLGIIYDCWEAGEAASYIKQGKPGLRKLRWFNKEEPRFQEVLT